MNTVNGSLSCFHINDTFSSTVKRLYISLEGQINKRSWKIKWAFQSLRDILLCQPQYNNYKAITSWEVLVLADCQSRGSKTVPYETGCHVCRFEALSVHNPALISMRHIQGWYKLNFWHCWSCNKSLIVQPYYFSSSMTFWGPHPALSPLTVWSVVLYHSKHFSAHCCVWKYVFSHFLHKKLNINLQMHWAVTHRRIYEACWTIKENLTVHMSGWKGKSGKL